MRRKELDSWTLRFFLAISCTAVLVGPGVVHAVELDPLIEKLPSPFLNFFRDATHILNRNVIEPATKINIQTIDLRSFWQWLDTWFARITGVPFQGILTSIGGFILWLLDLVTAPFRWLLSFIT